MVRYGHLIAVAAGVVLLGVDPAQGAPFVYAGSRDGVWVIDAATDTTTDNYDVGGVGQLAMSIDGRYLYVGSIAADLPFRVTIFDLQTQAVATTIALAGLARGIAVDPDGNNLWVSYGTSCGSSDCVGETGIAVIDLDDYSKEEVSVGDGGEIAIDASGVLYYVMSFFAISAFDTRTRTAVASLPIVCCLDDTIELHPDGRTVYTLGNEFGGFLGMIYLRLTPRLGRAVFVVGEHFDSIDFQTDIGFRPDGSRAYLPGYGAGFSGALFVMNTSDPLNPILEDIVDLGFRPRLIEVTQDRAYLTRDGSISVFDLDSRRVTTTIPLGSAPGRVVAGPGERNRPPAGSAHDDGCHMTTSDGDQIGLPLVMVILLLASLAGVAPGRSFRGWSDASDAERAGLHGRKLLMQRRLPQLRTKRYQCLAEGVRSTSLDSDSACGLVTRHTICSEET
jgi:DNA-binding beta-propeller fold protein YncE